LAECSVIPKCPGLIPDSKFPSATVEVPVGSTVAEEAAQPDAEFPTEFPEALKPLVLNTVVDTPDQ